MEEVAWDLEIMVNDVEGMKDEGKDEWKDGWGGGYIRGLLWYVCGKNL